MPTPEQQEALNAARDAFLAAARKVRSLPPSYERELAVNEERRAWDALEAARREAEGV